MRVFSGKLYFMRPMAFYVLTKVSSILPLTQTDVYIRDYTPMQIAWIKKCCYFCEKAPIHTYVKCAYFMIR